MADVIRVVRKCDQFDLNSKDIVVMHKCPKCGVRDRCNIHQSDDVESYKHVCDSCQKEWLQYSDEDIAHNRKQEIIDKEPYLKNEQYLICEQCHSKFKPDTKHECENND